MSASLVGSEMCIRDRVVSRLTLGSETWPVLAKSWLARLEGLLAGALAPVSYTHLTLPTICSV
eukprot:9103071-Alexandrium_andersonii.AAC.1